MCVWDFDPGTTRRVWPTAPAQCIKRLNEHLNEFTNFIESSNFILAQDISVKQGTCDYSRNFSRGTLNLLSSCTVIIITTIWYITFQSGTLKCFALCTITQIFHRFTVAEFMYRMGTSQGSSPDYFKGQSHILFKARTIWTWTTVVDHIPSRSVHLWRGPFEKKWTHQGDRERRKDSS